MHCEPCIDTNNTCSSCPQGRADACRRHKCWSDRARHGADRVFWANEQNSGGNMRCLTCYCCSLNQFYCDCRNLCYLRLPLFCAFISSSPSPWFRDVLHSALQKIAALFFFTCSAEVSCVLGAFGNRFFWNYPALPLQHLLLHISVAATAKSSNGAWFAVAFQPAFYDSGMVAPQTAAS